MSYAPNMAAMGLLAGMRGAQTALPDNRPVVPAPTHIQSVSKRNRTRLEKRLERAMKVAKQKARRASKNNQRGWFRRRKLNNPYGSNGYKDRVNLMTNWQRNQWARNGYDSNRIEHFIALPRRTK